jgi:hypothetical protein
MSIASIRDQGVMNGAVTMRSYIALARTIALNLSAPMAGSWIP